MDMGDRMGHWELNLGQLCNPTHCNIAPAQEFQFLNKIKNKQTVHSVGEYLFFIAPSYFFYIDFFCACCHLQIDLNHWEKFFIPLQLDSCSVFFLEIIYQLNIMLTKILSSQFLHASTFKYLPELSLLLPPPPYYYLLPQIVWGLRRHRTRGSVTLFSSHNITHSMLVMSLEYLF